MTLLQSALWANGALVIVVCAALALLLPARMRESRARLPLGVITPAAYCLYGALVIAYLFYPNYSDHAGPAMTGLGTTLLEGRPLYPPLDAHTFHGLLYGPLLAEVQAAAIFLGNGVADLPVIFSSKLAGVLALIVAGAFFFKAVPGWGFGRTYCILFLLPFHIVAFWNRCEPLLLLLVAFSFWTIATRPFRSALIILGACAGFASAFKLHACLYIAPAILVLLVRNGVSPATLLRIAVPAAGTFLLAFLPTGVSLPGFLEYLRFATRHGLSWQILLVNLLFAAALWSPLVVALATSGRLRAFHKPQLLGLGALHLLVAVVAAKPGAGYHHLLPFIPANALIFASFVDDGRDAQVPVEGEFIRHALWLPMLLAGLAMCTLHAWSMAGNWRLFERARHELGLIQERFPDVVMGLAGNGTYPLTYFRPQLERAGVAQVEYSSYMDLHLIGVSDLPLRLAFESCAIGHLAVPKGEPPFSMTTLYAPATPLFSDGLREVFGRRFVSVGYTTLYDIYECR